MSNICRQSQHLVNTTQLKWSWEKIFHGDKNDNKYPKHSFIHESILARATL